MSATFLCVVSELWCLILMFANAMLYAICHYSYVVRPHVKLQMCFAIFIFYFNFIYQGTSSILRYIKGPSSAAALTIPDSPSSAAALAVPDSSFVPEDPSLGDIP